MNYTTIRLNLDLARGELRGQWDLAGVFPIGADHATVQRWRQTSEVLREFGEQMAYARRRDINRGDAPQRNADWGNIWRDIIATKRPDAQQQFYAAGSPAEFLQGLGCEIFRRLFSTNRQDVPQAWNNRVGNNDPMRVRLLLQFNPHAAMELAQVPFEALCRGQGVELHRVPDYLVLADRISIVRRIDQQGRLCARALTPPLRVLVFAPAPSNQDAPLLNSEAEINGMRAVQMKLRSERIEFTVVKRGEANGLLPTFQCLRNMAQNCDVFHYIGHGTQVQQGQGGRITQVFFEQEDGTTDCRRVGELVDVLVGGGRTRLVVLNGCETAAVADFANFFPAVVAMQFRVSDAAAIAFAKAFYEELGCTGQLDDAVWKARQKIWTERPDNWLAEHVTPVLYMNSEDGLILKVPPSIVTDHLPAGERGVRYEAQLEASYGRPPYRWSARGLPPGLELDEDSGQLTGVPAAEGEWNVQIGVQTMDNVRVQTERRIRVGRQNLRILTEEVR